MYLICHFMIPTSTNDTNFMIPSTIRKGFTAIGLFTIYMLIGPLNRSYTFIHKCYPLKIIIVGFTHLNCPIQNIIHGNNNATSDNFISLLAYLLYSQNFITSNVILHFNLTIHFSLFFIYSIKSTLLFHADIKIFFQRDLHALIFHTYQLICSDKPIFLFYFLLLLPISQMTIQVKQNF